jgi:DNA-binding transcriptional MerR regulator
MSYTVKQLSDISGVTVRTLHHYDAIGLLRPDRVGGNGYRYYEEKQILALQQVLVLRELGLSLRDIDLIINSGSFDRLKALLAHRDALQERSARMKTMLSTVDKTISHLKGELEMADKELFDGLDPQREKEQRVKLIERYGEGASGYIDESFERTRNWQKSDFNKAKGDEIAINKKLVELMLAGLTAGDAKVQEVAGEHYRYICQFYQPTPEMYAGLGQMYLNSPDFKAHYDEHHEDLAQFLADAMAVYAKESLS